MVGASTLSSQILLQKYGFSVNYRLQWTPDKNYGVNYYVNYYVNYGNFYVMDTQLYNKETGLSVSFNNARQSRPIFSTVRVHVRVTYTYPR